ncbi:MAG: sugar-binding protein [Kiritimatiellia bacterium]|jgi:hypothetical protein
MKSILLTALLFLICPLMAAELYKCSSPPLIDGAEDTIWQEASVFPLFNIKADQPLVMETVARIMYDDQNLYAFVHCREVNLVEARDQMKYTRHDAPVWENGCVEFFLDVRNDGRAYYQFVVDVHGSAADLLRYDPDGPRKGIEWNGFWRRAVGTSADGWTVEVAIPWRSLNMTPSDQRLGLNISRVRRISPFERGTLAAGTSSISDLARFLIFENIRLEAPEVSAEIQPGAVFLGKNRMRLRVQNHTEAPVSGQLQLVGTAVAVAEVIMRENLPLELKAGETRDVAVDYRSDTLGRVQVTANLVQNQSVQFLDVADYVFRQPIELNDLHPLAFAGKDHPVYVRIFTDASEWTVDVTISDRQGSVCAVTENLRPSANAFLMLPTARLEPGDYSVRITLRHGGAISESDVPLTVIRQP